MAINTELRRSNGSLFSDTVYIKSHWSNIDGKPSNFPPTAHTHSATDIIQDASHRFVSDTEKSIWNAKESEEGAQTKADEALASAKSYTDTKIGQLINDAPEALDTLKELADALGDNEDAIAVITNNLANKVDKVDGKGLSTQDFTTELLTKLNGIEVGANKYIHPGYTSRVNGLYKITVDGTGHITNAVAVSKEDITALGIPSSDTNYYVTSASGNGNSTLTLTRNDGGKVSVNLSHSHSGYSLDGHTHEIDTLINSSGAKFSADWIPNLLASKITGGVFDVNRIPTLAISKISGLQTALDGKAPVDHTHSYAPSTHNHDSRYYTETEIDNKLVGYATNGHVHNQYLGRTEKAASASVADNAIKWGGYEIEVGSGLPGGTGKITFNI